MIEDGVELRRRDTALDSGRRDSFSSGGAAAAAAVPGGFFPGGGRHYTDAEGDWQCPEPS